MVQFVEGGTLQRADRVNLLMIRENPDVSVLGKVFGAVGGIAFITAGWFFWEMPVEDDGTGTLFARIALCAGLALIGAAIGWSALWPRKSITQMEVDLRKREVRLGTVKPDANFVCKHTLPFAGIKRFFAGSQTSHNHENAGGSTALYVEADSGPRNGAMLVGAVFEVEQLARELNAALETPVETERSSGEPQNVRRGGFGRRGL